MDRIAARIKTECLLGARFSLKERRSLWALLQDGRLKSRRLCTDYLRMGTLVRGNRRFIFEISDKLIPDHSEYVRWGVFHILGEYAETHPKQLWPLVTKWGSARSVDIRNGIGCSILEHIFQHHFAQFFGKAVRQASREPQFAYTISVCYKLGELEKPENSALFDAFLASRGLSKDRPAGL